MRLLTAHASQPRAIVVAAGGSTFGRQDGASQQVNPLKFAPAPTLTLANNVFGHRVVAKPHRPNSHPGKRWLRTACRAIIML